MITWERFMDILALHRQGLSLRQISDKLGIHRNTVTKYVTRGHPPKYYNSLSTPFWAPISLFFLIIMEQ